MSTTIDTFGIALPEGWVRIPLEDDEFERHLEIQRRRLASEAELSRTAERQVELLMRQLRNDCLDNNVSLLATLLAPLGDNDDGSGHELLAVGCTLSVIDRFEMGTDAPLTVNTLHTAMCRSTASERDGVQIVTLETPQVVDLPAGEAVRVVRSHRHRRSPVDGDEVVIYVHHALIPLGGRGDQALVATFCTPSVGHIALLAELFDEIIDTIRLFGDDDAVTDPMADPPAGDEPVEDDVRSTEE